MRHQGVGCFCNAKPHLHGHLALGTVLHDEMLQIPKEAQTVRMLYNMDHTSIVFCKVTDIKLYMKGHLYMHTL